MRRLTGNEHVSSEFATEWPLYDLDQKTHSLLNFTSKLTDAPATIEDEDLDALRKAGWDADGIWQATALISFFNFTGRLEAAAGLPPDKVPATSRFNEAKPDGNSRELKLRST